MTDAPRVVLDTNTVMALWWFEDPRLAQLAQALDAGALMPATRADALAELAAVLAYRQFGVPAERRHSIIEDYRKRCILPSDPTPVCALLPICRDADDQKFLELTRDARATLLITRDKMLLRLDRHRLIRPLYRIRTPEAVCDELSQREPGSPFQVQSH